MKQNKKELIQFFPKYSKKYLNILKDKNKIFNLGLLTTGIEPVPRTYKERNLTTNIREHNDASFIKKLSNLFIML